MIDDYERQLNENAKDKALNKKRTGIVKEILVQKTILSVKIRRMSRKFGEKSKQDLLDEAKKIGIIGRHKMKKEELSIALKKKAML